MNKWGAKMLNKLDLRNGNKQQEVELYNKLSGRTGSNSNNDVMNIVMDIIKSVREDGDKALYKYTQKFDKADLTGCGTRVSKQEIEDAYGKVDAELIGTIKKAQKNIAEFHQKQLQNSWIDTKPDGTMLGQLVSPIESVGLYVPGGTAPLISSVLMTAVPAKVAGVKRLVMCTPPAADATTNPAMLVAADIAGVDEIYKLGGAQAVAALAYGTESVSKVDKIVGPGNVFVATAKRLVFGDCDIDMFAGPSEILVIADNTATPSYIAADLLSQAEHDKLASSVLITDCEELIDRVEEQIRNQLEALSRNQITECSLRDYGYAILVDNLDEAIRVSNCIAPEHLELCTKEPLSLVGKIKNAGAIFIGEYSPEPLGDYFAGPSHVLPTSGTARFSSPVNVDQFIKKSSLIYYNKDALCKVSEDVVRFAQAELLDAHANAISVRME